MLLFVKIVQFLAGSRSTCQPGFVHEILKQQASKDPVLVGELYPRECSPRAAVWLEHYLYMFFLGGAFEIVDGHMALRHLSVSSFFYAQSCSC